MPHTTWLIYWMLPFFPPQLHSSSTLVGSFQRHQVLSIESLLQVLSNESFPLAESPLPICSDSSLDMGKLWYIHILNHFTTVKMNQQLPHFSTWIYQNIMGGKGSRCCPQNVAITLLVPGYCPKPGCGREWAPPCHSSGRFWNNVGKTSALMCIEKA